MKRMIKRTHLCPSNWYNLGPKHRRNAGKLSLAQMAKARQRILACLSFAKSGSGRESTWCTCLCPSNWYNLGPKHRRNAGKLSLAQMAKARQRILACLSFAKSGSGRESTWCTCLCPSNWYNLGPRQRRNAGKLSLAQMAKARCRIVQPIEQVNFSFWGQLEFLKVKPIPGAAESKLGKIGQSSSQAKGHPPQFHSSPRFRFGPTLESCHMYYT